MSTDGTKPPSITPKKRPARSGTTTASRPAPESPERPDTDDATRAVPRPVDTDERPDRDEPGGGPGATGPWIVSTEPVDVDEDEELSPSEAAAVAATGFAPRRVRLAVAKVDPWSVMKLSFLLSVAIGIMLVVAAAVVWYTLDSLAVFTRLNEMIVTITDDPNFFNILEYAAFDRVISLAVMIAVVDVVLLTALATIGAFLYNIVAALVGGIHVTLTDD